jgi:diguanylate cyclase (GGDEF)-like protein
MECIRCGIETESESFTNCPACRMPLGDENMDSPVDRAYLCDVPGRGRFLELKWDKNYVLGRGENADILLPSNVVSRAHAKIDWDGGQFFIVDLGASNGTFVNRVRVRRGPLIDGDVISIGPFNMVFRTVEPGEREWGDAETWNIKPEQVYDLESLGAEPWMQIEKASDGNATVISKDENTSGAIQDMIKELRKLALLDALTGLPNRRYLERTLRSRLDRMHRYGQSFGVLFIDVDNFKKVNDSYGHEVGDEVLKMVAQTLVRNIRSFDVVGRWGGEEFVAIIASVTEEELPGIAEKFRVLVGQSKLPPESHSVRVTVSIGAALAKPGDTKEVLLKKVDRLMYRSKARGKNRTTVIFRRPRNSKLNQE